MGARREPEGRARPDAPAGHERVEREDEQQDRERFAEERPAVRPDQAAHGVRARDDERADLVLREAQAEAQEGQHAGRRDERVERPGDQGPARVHLCGRRRDGRVREHRARAAVDVVAAGRRDAREPARVVGQVGGGEERHAGDGLQQAEDRAGPAVTAGRQAEALPRRLALDRERVAVKEGVAGLEHDLRVGRANAGIAGGGVGSPRARRRALGAAWSSDGAQYAAGARPEGWE